MAARRQTLVLVSVAVAIAGVGVPLRLLSSIDGDVRPAAAPTASFGEAPPTPQTTPQVFVPPTHNEGALTVMPVTFPDGSTAQLVYPPDLDLAGLGVRPYWAGCSRDFWFHHYDPIGTLYDPEGPLQTWTGADGSTVGLWHGTDEEPGVDGEPIDYLVFHFGAWTVLVYDYGGDAALTDEERAICAERLVGRETDWGWVVIDGPRSVGLGGGIPPELEIGDLAPDRGVALFAGECEDYDFEGVRQIDGVGVDLSKGFAAWCDPGGMMDIHVAFEPGSTFFEDVFQGLEIRNVRLAS
jgi:hypothetical protein